MKKIKEVMKKILTKEVILYLVFGIGSTIVNLVSFYIFTTFLQWEENIANMIAILLAVVFAYITNKNLVFHSKANTKKEKSTELIKFMSGRVVTMLIEWGGCALLFLTPIPQMISKLAMTIIVIITNFFISKFFVF